MYRIMIVHPEGNVNNNPNLRGIISILCEKEYEVDIYSPARENVDQSDPCTGARMILTSPKQLLFPVTAVLPGNILQDTNNLETYIHANIPAYDLIIGIDRGIIEAGLIAKCKKIPYGHISYEIVFEEEAGKDYLKGDRSVSDSLSFSVCQDPLRSFHLAKENLIDINKIIHIPVAGRGVKRGDRHFILHEKLGIPKDKKIALYIGNITDTWCGINELIESTEAWPEEWVLVLHHRYSNYKQEVIDKINLLQRKNIFISPFPSLPINQLGDLLYSANVGFGLYTPIEGSINAGNNLKYIGMASGKTTTYLQYGVPVIINGSGEMNEYVISRNLGKIIPEINKLPELLSQLSKEDFNKLRENCYSFFEEILDLDKRIEPLLTIIDELTGTTVNYAKQYEKSEPRPVKPAKPVQGTKIKVSAIVSTYKSEKYIRGCLDDLVNQTLFKSGEMEIVVINSNSPENEELIIKEYSQKYGNLVYVKTERRETLYAAWNRGIKLAKGRYITNANTDDRHRKDALEIMAKELDNNPGIGMVYGDALITEKENETFECNSAVQCYIFPECSLRQALTRQFFGPQPMWRKSVHETIGYFDPELVVAGDYDFFIRVVRHSGGKHIPEFLGLYTKRMDSVERSNSSLNDSEQKKLVSYYRNNIPIQEIYNLPAGETNKKALAAAIADLSRISMLSIPDHSFSLKMLSKALELDPESMEILNNTAVILWHNNDKKRATEILEAIWRFNDTARVNKKMCQQELASGVSQQLILTEIHHPVVEQLPPILMGALEKPVAEGQLVQQQSDKEQVQHSAQYWFEQASLNIQAGNYKQAELSAAKYRDIINYNDFEKKDNRSAKHPRVSVIIVAYNTGTLLLEALNSLQNQTSQDFEIIVVDNGRNELVLPQLLEYNILYIKTPFNTNPSEGRNIGVYFSRGTIIASLDDDAVAAPDYVESIIDAFSSSMVYAMRGKVLPRDPGLKDVCPVIYDLGDVPVPANLTTEGTSACLKDKYLELNGMNPLLFGGEGLDLSLRMFKKYGGIKIIYWPKAVIYHNPATGTKQEKKNTRYAAMNSYLEWLHPDIWKFNGIIDNHANQLKLIKTGEAGKKDSPAPVYNTAGVIMDEVPVVLIVYNRPWHTQQVINSLRRHKVKNLYVYCDAPKTPDGVDAVLKTREVVNSIDWTSPVIVNQVENQGLAKSITSAVDKIFETYDNVILLEDDCVPQDHFFTFMTDCLSKYKDNKKVFGVSGYTVQLDERITKDYPFDLYFSPRIGSWGWATWKDRWVKKENYLEPLLNKITDAEVDISQGGTDVPQMISGIYSGVIKDVWTINWLLTVYLHGGYYIYPVSSHITNIGMDGTGVHCGQTDKYNTDIAYTLNRQYPDNIFTDKNIIKNFRKYYDIILQEDDKSVNTGLKVVHLCSQDYGGAGIAAYRFHQGLREIGVNSTFIVLNKKSKDPGVKVIPETSPALMSHCFTPAAYDSLSLARHWFRWMNNFSKYPLRPSNLELFSDSIGTKGLENIKEIQEADIINLHWVSGMINIEDMPVIFSNKKIVWTLHDMNSFTGGCHYTSGCSKFTNGCGACPQLGSSTDNDLSKQTFTIKQESYKHLDINVVTPSKWLGKESQNSSLLSKFGHHVIPYGLPLDIFKPHDKKTARSWAGIDGNKKIVLFGAESVVNKRKGLAYLVEALSTFSDSEASGILLLTFGANPVTIEGSGYEIKNLGPVNDLKLLSAVYSMADVYVIPSMEDNLPNTVLESLACGTPVVGFNTGGIPDMVEHKKTGYLVQPGNSKELAEAIKWVIKNSDNYRMPVRCREKAESDYELKNQAKKLASLYNNILGQKQTTEKVNRKKHQVKQKFYKVSAIVSAYNSEKYMQGCLDDLVNQTLYAAGELQIVIVNSGSQQNEEAIIKKYQDKYSHIKYIKTERETIYKAWNRGIKAASGKYVTNANTDDRHRKDAFEVMAAYLDNDKSTGLVYADSFVTKVENETFDNFTSAGWFNWPEFDRTQLIHCACIGPQPLWRKELHSRYGYFNESMKVSGDYDWWLRISEHTGLKHIPEKLGLYLLSDESAEHKMTSAMRNETISLRVHYAEKAGIKTLDYNKYKSTFLVLADEHNPLVSVIIPAHNRKEKLPDAINSVLAQTYPNVEVIVVNDGGSDVTEIVKNFDDSRIKVFSHTSNKGPAAARNTGIKNASGKYIALLDDDDIFYPHHLQTALDNLKNGCKVVYTDAVRNTYVKIDDQYILSHQSVPYSIEYKRDKLLLGNIAAVNSFVFEKALTDEAGLFDESFQVLEDWEFWIRLSSVAEFKHVKENTVQVNWYNDGTTLTSSKQQLFRKYRELVNKKYSKQINDILDTKSITDEFAAIWQRDSIPVPLVSIIALSYNQLEYTKAFIESVFKNTPVPFELIIIDNNSGSETVNYLEELAQKSPAAKVIFNKENFGFPKGVNQGIKAAAGRYIVIANNDIIVTPGWLNRMLTVAEQETSFGIVGPVSNSVSGVQLDKDAKYDSIEGMFQYAEQLKKNNNGKFFIFPRVAFLCTLIKREVFEKIGGLDERFTPGNFEDDDFCLRAQLAGYKTIIAQDVFIHHFGSKSFTAEGIENYSRRLETNKKIFVNKWGGDPEEIWLQGKPVKQRKLIYSLNKNPFTENFERALVQVEEADYVLAHASLKKAFENFSNKGNYPVTEEQVTALISNLEVLINSSPVESASLS